jgi:hypothetical protein
MNSGVEGGGGRNEFALAVLALAADARGERLGSAREDGEGIVEARMAVVAVGEHARRGGKSSVRVRESIAGPVEADEGGGKAR